MGRPDLTELRTKQILDAFERCVGQVGLEASSLERIAQEAGMKRSILRHYVGNREELVVALTRRVVGKYRETLVDMAGSIAPPGRVEQLIRILLPAQSPETTASIVVIESLIAAADTNQLVREQMAAYLDDVVAMVSEQLQQEFPDRSRHQCWTIAYGVVCIWFNHASLGPLRLARKYLTAARSTMRTLISTLD